MLIIWARHFDTQLQVSLLADGFGAWGCFKLPYWLMSSGFTDVFYFNV